MLEFIKIYRQEFLKDGSLGALRMSKGRSLQLVGQAIEIGECFYFVSQIYRHKLPENEWICLLC